jgi:serine phosphatase RsbU (regulator of sigma subunit)
MYSKVIQKNDAIAALNNTRIEQTINSINILVVEDEPEIADRIIEVLEESANLTNLPPRNYRKAYNGLKALYSLIEEDKAGWMADLVVSDITMPVLDGPGVVHKLRNDKKYAKFSHIPVILISSYVDNNEEKIEIYKKTGAEFVFFKDLDDKTLWFMFNTTLRLVAKEKLLYKKNQIIFHQKEALEKEIEIARDMLESCLPDELPIVKNATLAYSRIAAISVSGDLVNFKVYEKYNDIVRIFICDVSGHGLPAASIAEKVYKVLEKQKTGKYVINNQPGEALTEINHRLENQLKSYYFTAYMCFYNDITGSFSFARAAHPYIAIIKNNKDIQFIKSKGKPIDGVALERKFENITIQLEPGDKVLLYTDGLTEAENREGERIGCGEDTTADQDLEIFKNWLTNNIDFSLPPQQICDLIEKKVYEFTGTTELTDDLATVVLEYSPK